MVVEPMDNEEYETLEQLGELPYPFYVQTEEQKNRWDASTKVAMAIFDEPQGTASVIGATRSIYHSDIPT
jgi:S-adenosylmethionine:tRNA-ribosyltransferase-isomerase (queuine synthetase)